MSEEEIIKVLNYQLNMKGTDVYAPINYDAIQGLLDLYNKQKEEIKALELIHETYKEEMKSIEKRFISKDKIRDKKTKLEEIYQKEMKPYQTEYGLNLSLLSKKEREEVINKRNTLLIEIEVLNELLEEK